jgi:hypothetical protein
VSSIGRQNHWGIMQELCQVGIEQVQEGTKELCCEFRQKSESLRILDALLGGH